MPQDDASVRPLTTTQVAEIFGVSISAVADWAKQNRLPYFRTPGGEYRFQRADVEAFLAQFKTSTEGVA
jgi:excisionase family DNA binding protein